ncbi:MAG TPA: hypothetical protein VIM53_03220 [Candidatus Saccharimonadales bacterium]
MSSQGNPAGERAADEWAKAREIEAARQREAAERAARQAQVTSFAGTLAVGEAL